MARYNLIFQGKIIDGAPLDKVKRNIAQLFKIDAAKTESLFSGKPVIIKKNLSTESAKKYLSVLKKAGAIVKAVKIITAAPPPPKKSPQNNSPQTSKLDNPISSGLASRINYNNKVSSNINEDKGQQKNTLQLAPIGSYKVASSNIQKKIKTPDISHLTMSAAQSGSLEEYAAAIEEIELPDIDNLSMSAANTGSLEEFSLAVTPAELPDISDLDIVQQDNTPLSSQSPKQNPAKLPDITKLSMSEAQQGTLEGVADKAKTVEIPDISHLKIKEINKKSAITGKATFKIS